jgi:hypothetical protein
VLEMPIFRAVVQISSRRVSTYGTRAAYGLLLLGFVWIFHHSHEAWSAGRLLPNKELAEFAAAAFEWLAVPRSAGSTRPPIGLDRHHRCQAGS